MKIFPCPKCNQKPNRAKVTGQHVLCGGTLYTYYCPICRSISVGYYARYNNAVKAWNRKVKEAQAI